MKTGWNIKMAQNRWRTGKKRNQHPTTSKVGVEKKVGQERKEKKKTNPVPDTNDIGLAKAFQSGEKGKRKCCERKDTIFDRPKDT